MIFGIESNLCYYNETRRGKPQENSGDRKYFKQHLITRSQNG